MINHYRLERISAVALAGSLGVLVGAGLASQTNPASGILIVFFWVVAIVSGGYRTWLFHRRPPPPSNGQ